MYEAMAAGKPIVFFPQDEDIGEFAEPFGAFKPVAAATELSGLILRALDERTTYRARSRAFLERHVSIEPQRPAPLRIACALGDLAARN
jgi:hypothetical protein